MHMADALLSPFVGITMSTISVATIGVSVARVKMDEFSEKKVPIMGVAGAMIFAAQMINFSIPATGSSGHIGGGILLAGLLGGIPAFLSIAAVLIIQCLFFADGGLLALGANIFNLGVLPCLVAYPFIFKPIVRRGVGYRRLTIASIVAATAGLELGAFFVVLQTLASGITELPFGTFVILMLPIHLAIGLIEGIVTAAVLCFVYKMRPELIESAQLGQRLSGVSMKRVIVAIAVITVLIGGVLSLFASTSPGGLEWAIEKTTERSVGEATELETEGAIFDHMARVQESTSFLPGYAFEQHPEKAMGTSVSGIVGAAITFALAGAAGFIITVVKKGKKGRKVETDV